MSTSPVDAIVFVVDSADTDRIPIAKTELMAILNVTVPCGMNSRKRNCKECVFLFLPTSRM